MRCDKAKEHGKPEWRCQRDKGHPGPCALIKNEMHTITLILGDNGGDGHEKRARVVVSSSLPLDELLKAYKAGEKKTKVKLMEEANSRYEDSAVPTVMLKKLVPFGYKMPGKYNWWTDEFASAWMFIASVGNPDLKWEMAKEAPPETFIGGYGFFT